VAFQALREIEGDARVERPVAAAEDVDVRQSSPDTLPRAVGKDGDIAIERSARDAERYSTRRRRFIRRRAIFNDNAQRREPHSGKTIRSSARRRQVRRERKRT
jgi:hypothetical protein